MRNWHPYKKLRHRPGCLYLPWVAPDLIADVSEISKLAFVCPWRTENQLPPTLLRTTAWPPARPAPPATRPPLRRSAPALWAVPLPRTPLPQTAARGRGSFLHIAHTPKHERVHPSPSLCSDPGFRSVILAGVGLSGCHGIRSPDLEPQCRRGIIRQGQQGDARAAPSAC